MLTDIETGNIQDFHQGLVARIGTAAFSSHIHDVSIAYFTLTIDDTELLVLI